MKIQVVIKEPDKEPEVKMIESDLLTFETIVEGWIQIIDRGIDGDVQMIINEEGLLLDLPYNFTIPSTCERIVGTVIFANCYKGGDDNLTSEDIENVMKFLKECAPKETPFGKWLDDYIAKSDINLNEVFQSRN